MFRLYPIKVVRHQLCFKGAFHIYLLFRVPIQFESRPKAKTCTLYSREGSIWDQRFTKHRARGSKKYRFANHNFDFGLSDTTDDVHGVQEEPVMQKESPPTILVENHYNAKLACHHAERKSNSGVENKPSLTRFHHLVCLYLQYSIEDGQVRKQFLVVLGTINITHELRNSPLARPDGGRVISAMIMMTREHF